MADHPYRKTYPLRSGSRMSTSGSTSTESSTVVTTAVITTTTSSESERVVPVVVGSEADLDKQLEEKQKELDDLAAKQRALAKQTALARLQEECSKMTTINNATQQHLYDIQNRQSQLLPTSPLPVPQQQPPQTRVPQSAPSQYTDATIAAIGGLNLGGIAVSSNGGNPILATGHLTANTLRQDVELQERVSKQIDRLGLDPSSSSSSSSESTDSDENSDNRRSRKHKKKKKSKRRSRSKSKSSRHKSGKCKKLTSHVPFPQRWPHTYLSLQYVGKEKKYEDLTIAEFSAGFATLIERAKTALERDARIAFLRELMYFSTTYRWSSVLDYHAACLMEIERGHLKWGDSFHHLVHTTLVPNAVRQNDSRKKPKKSKDKDANTNGYVRFCSLWQRGQCKKTGDHEGTLNGREVTLRHICAKCWLNDHQFASHPESECTGDGDQSD